MTTKVLMAWSGGKDSAAALRRLQQDPAYEVTGLITSLTTRFNRVQMHGVRRVLLEAQADSLGLPLTEVWLEPQADNAAYEEEMGAAMAKEAGKGIQAVAFGDLFLEDIRAYRERLLAPLGLQPLFPLWGENTTHLARDMVESGFKATLTCIDPKALDPDFAGRSFDKALLADLPQGVDPCGENGEFHTFVHDAPNFRYPLRTMMGVKVERMGFFFADLLPVAQPGLPPRETT